MEISDLSDKEFKITAIKSLSELGIGVDAHRIARDRKYMKI